MSAVLLYMLKNDTGQYVLRLVIMPIDTMYHEVLLIGSIKPLNTLRMTDENITGC